MKTRVAVTSMEGAAASTKWFSLLSAESVIAALEPGALRG